MELSTVLSLVLVLLGYLWWKVTRPKSFPPGPLALPIVGNLLQMNFKNPLQGMKEFSKVYGPVCSIYLGFTPVVVVRGFKALKEILITRGVEFADRPHNRITLRITEKKGLAMAPYGQAWKEHRRFTLCTLRNFGLGKKSMEERIAEESSYLIQEFEKHMDTPLDPHFAIDNAVSNNICSIVFGRRYDYDDSTFRDVLDLVHENMTMATSIWAQLYNAFGFIHYLPLPHQKIFRNVDTVFGFLGNVLEEHRKSRQPGEPRDYIDCYLEELDKEKKESNNKQTFGNQNLFSCVVDLFVAGTETTSASLEWALLYMMAFPDIQEKCRNEIDKVRGDRERLDYGDRVNMPYTQAVLQEVQRFTTIVPLGVAHSTQKNVKLNGFTIPKGTFIMTDLSSLHSDETYWKYPHEFNPENFLNEDGELLKAESFLPFSAGPRSCLGENLARMEIFLFFTTFLTHFEFHCSDPTSPPDLTPVFGITHAPKRFKMRLVSRS
ncbi:cytochrome P450 2J6-like [Pelobates cultripes]|uniref:Cytochrome P450 2J6-like n=1 Tax=Pelobates cultripes TaxID=61616 RepID=A0AAD1WW00_PELCU|nr:cytochrome P450 2J6-like [Pelobates cultripes]